jgi:hypothetical protein
VQRFHADPGLLLLHSDAWLVDAQGAPLGQRLLEVLVVHPAEVELERSGLAIDAILLRNFITGATCALRRGLLPDRCRSRRAGATTNGWRSTHRCVEDWTCWPNRPSITGSMATTRSVPVAAFPATPAPSICSTQARQRTAGRLLALAALLGSAAWWWRRTLPGTSRARLAHGLVAPATVSPGGVPARWIAHDAPRLIARLANVCLAGAAGGLGGVGGAGRVAEPRAA